MGQIIGNDGNIYCPYCDGEENHIMQVYTVIDPTGDENYQHEGVTNFVERSTAHRRSALEIEFYCEMCPGVWYLSLQQHKGITEVTFYKGERFHSTDDIIRYARKYEVYFK